MSGRGKLPAEKLVGTIEDARWVKKYGQWRRVIDEVDAITYNERRKSPTGFHRGARVTRK